MKARSMLLAQIESSVEGIVQALNGLKPDKLDSALLERIQARFENDLKRSLNKLVQLRDSVKQLGDDGSLELPWGQLNNLRAGAAPVLEECLAFIEGALTRSQGVDGGLCRVTDSMLYELSRRTDIGWNRFTILAAGEFFASISGIIRINFPDLTFWNLPVAAHEFGHYVAANLKDPALRAMIDREKRTEPKYEAHLNEHFADLFATYTMGPCFGLACGLVRFSPASAFQRSATHPSFAHRVWWIVEALRSIEQLRGGPPLYDYIAGELEKSWQASLSAAGQNTQMEIEDTRRLRGWLAEMLEIVDGNLAGALYGGWLRAQALAASFRAKEVPALTRTDRIPDVLNAIWLCRSEQETADAYQISWLADKGFELCKQMVKDCD